MDTRKYKRSPRGRSDFSDSIEPDEEPTLDYHVLYKPKFSSNLKTSSTVNDWPSLAVLEKLVAAGAGTPVIHKSVFKLEQEEEDVDSSKDFSTRVSVSSTTDDDEDIEEETGHRRETTGGTEPYREMLEPNPDVLRGSVGSPGVPGRPILHLPGRPSPPHSSGHARLRKLAKSVPKGFMIDSATQTASNASTQTSDTDSSSEEPAHAGITFTSMSTSPLEYVPSMVLFGDSPVRPESKNSQFRSLQQEGIHRRSVSWDPPSLMLAQALGSDPKNPKSMVMLNQILKEKREELLQREMEIKKEKERQQQEQQRIQLQQQQQQQQERLQLQLQQEQRRLQQEQRLQQQEQSPRLEATRHRKKESMTKLPIPSVSVSPSHHSSPHLISTVPSSLSSTHLAPPSPSHLTPPSPAQALQVRTAANHHRSKSDPNVIPLLLKGLQTPGGRAGYGASPQIASALAAMHAMNAATGNASLHTSSRSKMGQPDQPRASSSMSSRRGAPVSPATVTISDKQKELIELEKKIEAKQRQLMDKGFNVSPFVPKEERRRDWASSLQTKDNDLLSSLEDIEEEIEMIKQRTMDIQDKVQLLEERCVAPDPLSMMFGDHGSKRAKPQQQQQQPPPQQQRVSPYHPISPTYLHIHDSSPQPFAPHSESSFKRTSKKGIVSPEAPVRPRMAKYSSAPVPIPALPMGPDVSKRKILGPRSAFSPPTVGGLATDDGQRSAFSPPPRPIQDEIHWTRL